VVFASSSASVHGRQGRAARSGHPDQLATAQKPELLSENLRRVRIFESEMAEFAKRNIPGKVAVDYNIDIDPITREAKMLIAKFGETMEFYHLGYIRKLEGKAGGLWTCLSMKAVNGDMCDDRSPRHVSQHAGYSHTRVWHEAPHIRKLLEPIDFALKRVRFSIMRPATMVAWHCDDCAKHALSPPGCRHHEDHAENRERWLSRYHRWVRLHLMIDSNKDIDFALGGERILGTTHGNFYLANVAMPHRVDNPGSSSRIALLVDVQIDDMRERLMQSQLGQSILKALGTIEAIPKARETYLDMGMALYKYQCNMKPGDRYETEWHARAWSRPMWRPLPPFQATMFNSPNHCGIFGPAEENRKPLELVWQNEDSPDVHAERVMLSTQKKLVVPTVTRRRRRRRSMLAYS